jgi:hypothetical protein
MDEDLQELARELRKETCPQRVLDEVARRISAQTPAPNRFRYEIAAALAAAVVLCGIVLLRWPSREGSAPAPVVVQREMIDRVQVARQVEGTFAYIGQVMVDASAHSQRVILNDAVPQLRNSFETAKDKLMNHIEL